MKARTIRGHKVTAGDPAKRAAPGPIAPLDPLAAAQAIHPNANGVSHLLVQHASAERRLVMRPPELQPRASSQPPPRRVGDRRAVAELVKKATSLRQSGNLFQAIPLLRQALAADPDNPEVLLLLGTTLLNCGGPSEAVAALERAVVVKPNSAQAHYAFGTALQTLARDEAAIAAYQRAAELAPGMVDAHLQLARLVGRHAGPEAAQECLRRAAVAGRRTTAGRICEGLVLAGEQKYQEAADCLRQALAREPRNYFASAMLAQTLAHVGDIDAAVAQYRRALEQARGPTDDPTLVWLYLPQLTRVTGADRPMIEEMRAYVQRPHVFPLTRMKLHFALGKAFDDLRDYEQAIRHYDAANQIRRGLQPFDRDSFVRQLDAVIAQYTPRFFAEHAGDGLADDTAILVVGMPRSGTTLVEQILASHPQIGGAGELNFWIDSAEKLGLYNLGTTGATEVRRLAGEYLAELRGVSATAVRVTDKMPFNFHFIGLIRHALPKARFIHCRRHPIDTCLSIYFTDFEKIRALVGDRDDLVFFYNEYLRLMQHWRAVLPPECFIEVDYETLIADPEAQARRLVAFCGLDWDPGCLHPEKNHRPVKTASLWQVRRPIYRTSLDRWRHYEPWLGSFRELMPSI
jgi:tetratricopeptide (TPR) repeat protein